MFPSYESLAGLTGYFVMRKLLLLISFPALFLATAVLAQAENGAGLVISLADGEVVTRCVSFAGAQLSGFDLLQRSGLALEVNAGGAGTAVCRIESIGCPGDDCFCDCKGGEQCRYWSYWHRQDGEWQYSQVGASVYQVRPGAVEGWAWGPGSPNEATPPPDFSFEEICSETAVSASQPISASEPTAVPWLQYAFLGLILLGMAFIFWRVQRRGRA